MDHRLSVVVEVDLHGRYVRLVVTRCVTETNQYALCPLIRRARLLIPPVSMAVNLLRWAVGHDELTPEGAGSGQLITPTALPDHRPTQASRHRQASRWLAA